MQTGTICEIDKIVENLNIIKGYGFDRFFQLHVYYVFMNINKKKSNSHNLRRKQFRKTFDN